MPTNEGMARAVVKATPGPWVAIQMKTDTARALQHGEPPIHENGIWWILPEDDYERLPIAIIDKANDSHAPTREHAEADARLIAAAPDLLEACFYMHKLLVDMGHGGLAGAVLGENVLAKFTTIQQEQKP